MDLRTVKEIARLKAQVGPLQRQFAERLNAAIAQAKSTAIAEFKDHFTKGGFTVVGEARRYAATYEGMQFFLEVGEKPGTLSFCEFSLVPPPLLNEPKVTVRMIRKGPPSLGRPFAAEQAGLLRDAERVLRTPGQHFHCRRPSSALLSSKRKMPNCLLLTQRKKTAPSSIRSEIFW